MESLTGFELKKTKGNSESATQTSARRSRCDLPEAKVKEASLLLLHVALEATTTAEYCFPQSSFTEQVVVLEEQKTT